MMSSISVSEVPFSELESYVKSFLQSATPEDTIPISLSRANSQLKNPVATPEDRVLLVATLGSRMVGYLGLLPGLLCQEGRLSKVYFSTTAYVPKEFRRTGAGLSLIRTAAKLPYDLIGCDNRPEGELAWRLVDGTTEMQLPIAGLRVENLHRYYSKKTFEWKLEWANAEEIRNISESLAKRGSAALFRSPKIVGWMLENPWIVERESVAPSERTYYFAEFHLKVEYLSFKMFSQNGHCLGYQVFSLVTDQSRNIRTLKILDSLLYSPLSDEALLHIASHLGREFGATLIETEMQKANILNPLLLLGCLQWQKNRSYFLRPYSSESPLAKATAHFVPQFCDGDTSFS